MSTFLISLILTVSVVIFHHECLLYVKHFLPTKPATHQRWIVGSTVLFLILAHVVEISVFAAAYHVVQNHFQTGQILGDNAKDITSVLYFSFASYTTLGIGDLYPTGSLRLLCGIEGLLGLLMIGWSASFIYLEMRTLWLDYK